MKPTSKVYYVYELREEIEVPVGVCATRELAEKLRDQTIEDKEIKCNISEEKLAKMLDFLHEYEDRYGEICESEEEGLCKLYPDIDPEDIEAACRKCFDFDDFITADIEEVDFYTDEE